jgi:hypothetical protein
MADPGFSPTTCLIGELGDYEISLRHRSIEPQSCISVGFSVRVESPAQVRVSSNCRT